MSATLPDVAAKKKPDPTVGFKIVRFTPQTMKCSATALRELQHASGYRRTIDLCAQPGAPVHGASTQNDGYGAD